MTVFSISSLRESLEKASRDIIECFGIFSGGFDILWKNRGKELLSPQDAAGLLGFEYGILAPDGQSLFAYENGEELKRHVEDALCSTT